MDSIFATLNIKWCALHHLMSRGKLKGVKRYNGLIISKFQFSQLKEGRKWVTDHEIITGFVDCIGVTKGGVEGASSRLGVGPADPRCSQE